jgi:hypothetical protein
MQQLPLLLDVLLLAHVNYTPSSQGVDINILFIFRPQGMLVVSDSVRGSFTNFTSLRILPYINRFVY